MSRGENIPERTPLADALLVQVVPSGVYLDRLQAGPIVETKRMEVYLQRTLEHHFREANKHFPVVLVTGAQEVGKATFL